MGAVHFSIDKGLIAALKKVLPLETFVETGTFEGDTIELVRSLFPVIHSVELSEDYYRKVEARFKNVSNVHLHLGHSADVLQKMRQELKEASVLFWLDAHWCVADKTAGGESQCPLLEELQALASLGHQSVVLIDDARLFLSPPPYPHEVSHWPGLEEILAKLRGLSNQHEVMIANDVLIYYPTSARTVVREYAYGSSIDWLQAVYKSKNYDAVKTEFDNLQRQFDFLHVQFDGLQRQLEEKDEEIHGLHGVAEERLKATEAMRHVADERLNEINSLKGIAEERSRVIHLINEELETIKRHWAYRMAARIKKLLRG